MTELLPKNEKENTVCRLRITLKEGGDCGH